MNIIGLPKSNETTETKFVPAFPTEFPSFQQIKAYENLIKVNPPGEKWQGAISDIKNQYPEQFGSMLPFDTNQIENLSSSDFENFNKSFEEYQKITFPGVKPVSISSGLTVITANPDKNNFFAEVETQLDNFIKLSTNVENFALDLPGEIKSVSNLLSSSSQSFIGQIGNTLTDGLIDYTKLGLDGIATNIFSQNLPFNKANTSQNYGITMAVGYSPNWGGNGAPTGGYMNPNVNYSYLMPYNSNGLTFCMANEIGNGTRVICGITYMTNS